MSNYFALEDGQLVVSPELLVFLQWLVQNEPAALKKLITRALRQGILSKNAAEKTLADSVANMQEIVTDFFSMVDLLVADAQSNKKRVPALKAPHPVSKAADQVDSSACDDETVAFSVARTAQALKRNTKLDARETLYKELLKNWSPRDKNVRH